jgi:hypothetical protein
VEFKSCNAEVLGVQRALVWLLDAGLSISGLCIDRNDAVMRMMTQTTALSDIELLVDTWHQSKSVIVDFNCSSQCIFVQIKRILRELVRTTKNKTDRALIQLHKSSIERFFWCICSEASDPSDMLGRYMNMFNHLSGNHDNCEHGLLSDTVKVLFFAKNTFPLVVLSENIVFS